MKEKIRIGFRSLEYNDENTSWILEHVCSCGFVSEAEYPVRMDAVREGPYECGQCGNRNFLEKDGVPDNKRVALPTFFDNKSDYQGLDFKKTNLSLKYDKDKKKINVIQPNMVRRYIFNWVNKELKVYKNEELEYDYDQESDDDTVLVKRRVSNYLAKGFSKEGIIEALDVENKEFYLYLIDELGYSRGWGRRKNSLFSIFEQSLDNHSKYNWAQILANAGYTGISKIYTGRNYNLESDDKYNKSNILKHETKPHKILRVSKRMSKYLRDFGPIRAEGHKILVVISQDTEKLQTLSSLIDSMEGEDMFYEALMNIDNIHHMIDVHNYDGKALLEYVTDEIRMYQGILSARDGLYYLRDYANMSQSMGIPFEKYPNSLKREHDVTSLNYREYMNTKKTQEFSKVMKENDYLADKKKEYSVLLPETSKDLVYEGGRLNHCVGSYVDQVAKGETVIAFLRKTKNIHEPLVTLEVKGHQVKQARGAHNRALSKEESDFISEWAEERQLAF